MAIEPWNAANIDVQVDEPFVAAVSIALVTEAVRNALRVGGVSGIVEVSVLVTDDASLRELNRTYRGQDKGTDVLSFGLGEDSPPLPPDVPRPLGDIVVSYPRVEAQAQAAGWSTADELNWLVIHGALHLLGLDDEDEEGRAEMWALGEVALGKPAPGIPGDAA